MVRNRGGEKPVNTRERVGAYQWSRSANVP